MRAFRAAFLLRRLVLGTINAFIRDICYDAESWERGPAWMTREMEWSGVTSNIKHPSFLKDECSSARGMTSRTSGPELEFSWSSR